MLIDTAKIKIKAGNGGDGLVSFRRAKFIPKGGPDGGDGGNGGSVILVADNNMETLLDFRAKSVFAASPGEQGKKKKMFGGAGDDLIVRVPVGTLVYVEATSGKVLVCDMSESGMRYEIAKGGRGGKGNFRFRSSTNQTPIQYTPGGQGEEKTVLLEIKMVADVGLVGFPNAGKSTLLNYLTNSNAKVASYPFTTLNPNLGTLRTHAGKEIIFADIPGLVEGASQGKGLGDEFLKHIERTRIIVHLIDPSDFSFTKESSYAENARKMYDIIRQELATYRTNMESKPEIVVITKMDLTETREAFAEIRDQFKKHEVPVIGISAATGDGVKALIDAVLLQLESIPRNTSFETTKPVKMFNINNLPNKRIVFRQDVLEV